MAAAAAAAQEQRKLQSELSSQTEAAEDLKRLWAHTHERMAALQREEQQRYAAWDAERNALYAELANFRAQLLAHGIDAPEPQLPPPSPPPPPPMLVDSTTSCR